MKDITVNIEELIDNSVRQDTYEDLVNPDHGRAELISAIHQKMNSTDWKTESKYYTNKYKPKYKKYTDAELDIWEQELLESSHEDLMNKHNPKLEEITNTINRAYTMTYSEKYPNKVLREMKVTRE